MGLNGEDKCYRCGTVRGTQEFLFKKLGHKVFVFDPYVFADLKSPEKHVGFTFISDDKTYNLRI
jgi:hypothetical protein